MRINVLCMGGWESRVDRALLSLPLTTELKQSLVGKDYGREIAALLICFRCFEGEQGLSSTARLNEEKNLIEVEIVLDWMGMVTGSPAERAQRLIQALELDVPALIREIHIPAFEVESFINDYQGVVQRLRN